MPVIPETKLELKLARLNEIRLMLDWMEQHPELINDSLMVSNHIFVYPPHHEDDEAKRTYVLDAMRPLVRSLNDGATFGMVKKIDSDYYYGYERRFGNGLVVSINAHNQGVCQYVESDELEDVEIVDIPERVTQEYTKIVSRPKMVKVCPKLFVD
jgi:hypothetical protein